MTERQIRAVEVLPRTIAAIRSKTGLFERFGRARDLLPEVRAFLAEHGIEPTGRNVFHFAGVERDAEGKIIFDLYTGIEVGEVTPTSDRVERIDLAGGPVITATFRGPYDEETLEPEHRAMEGWLKENGKTYAGVFEVFGDLDEDASLNRVDLFYRIKA